MSFVLIDLIDGMSVISFSMTKELPTLEPIKNTLVISSIMRLSMLAQIITWTFFLN
jgi:hypothetical protein